MGIDLTRILRLAAAIALCLLPLRAYAWGGDGHRIVCAIAWREMTAEAQRQAETLLHIRGADAFAEQCLWADQYRDQGHPETAAWHFVAVTPGATRVGLARDCGGPESCVVAQINRDISIIDGQPGNDKATALKFLIHFIGDVHQPLRIGHRKDHNGQSLTGRFMGRPTNLLAVWDAGLIEYAGLPWQVIADSLWRKVTRVQRQEWTGIQLIDWAKESLAVANDPATLYTAGAAPFDLSEAYAQAMLPVVYDRLSHAGVRLGHVLNETLVK